jgi:hypothetical protein
MARAERAVSKRAKRFMEDSFAARRLYFSNRRN